MEQAHLKYGKVAEVMAACHRIQFRRWQLRDKISKSQHTSLLAIVSGQSPKPRMKAGVLGFPILEKCGTWASPVPRRSEKWLYRYGRMALPGCKPLQRLEIGFRKRQNPFVGNYTSGMAKPRILAFLRLLWLRCLNDKASHRFQGEDIPDCL